MIVVKEKLKKMWVKTTTGDKSSTYLGEYKITTIYVFWIIPIFTKIELVKSNF